MFIVQKSKNKERVTRLTGITGDTAILLVIDLLSGALKGVTCSSKAPPLTWLNRHLAKIRPKHVEGCFALMDQGSELGRSDEIRKLLELHGYALRTSAPDMHNQTGQVERPVQTVSGGIRSMLHAAKIEVKYWPYAYYHFELIYNTVPRGTRPETPFQIATGKRPDLSKLRTWGCRVYVRPSQQRASKLENHCNIGTFLGYTATMSQIHYLDHRTKRIKTSAHVRFDEGVNGVRDLPPNAIMLRQASGYCVDTEQEELGVPEEVNLFAQSSCFPEVVETSFSF